MLVVEDHADVGDVVRRALEADGHTVAIAPSATEADALVGREAFGTAVLDLGLPDGHGLAWCKRVRDAGKDFPILVLTAESALAIRVAAFDAGADDYLAKPFAVVELRARVRALGRRGPLSLSGERRLGDVRLDPAARRAWLGANEVPLTAREWRIIELLASRRGQVVPRSEIVSAIWGDASAAAASASLEVIVGRIRKKLGVQFIRTVRSEGYAID